ncbi:MAG: amino acid ABC transporter substrate-binding protein [Micrococcales bacterium]|nr:amino acid ABC transporter substrate-binding protein [Micrococcales bacterium]
MPSRRTRLATAVVFAAFAALALAGCAGESSASDYVTEGKLTIATSQPAYPPYVLDNAPQSGKGFEAAVAYAVADKLGFAEKDVVWTRVDFDKAIAPGPKDFDLNLQQYSITDARKKKVDFSSPYFEAPQAVVALAGSRAAAATGIAGLRSALLGVQTGTTSLTAIQTEIEPTQQPQVFNTNSDAVAALKSKQVDAIVVDLPTAFYLTSAELEDGTIVGQLADSGAGGEEWGILLPKGSALTAKVSKAVDALRADGTLAALQDEWLGGSAGAPVLR